MDEEMKKHVEQLKQEIFDGTAINYEMTFEQLMTRLPDPSVGARLTAIWRELPLEHRQAHDAMITFAYMLGKEDASRELQNIAKQVFAVASE